MFTFWIYAFYFRALYYNYSIFFWAVLVMALLTPGRRCYVLMKECISSFCVKELVIVCYTTDLECPQRSIFGALIWPWNPWRDTDWWEGLDNWGKENVDWWCSFSLCFPASMRLSTCLSSSPLKGLLPHHGCQSNVACWNLWKHETNYTFPLFKLIRSDLLC